MILHAVTAIDFTSLHLSPVLWRLHLFGRDLFDLKWYSIAYIAGIILGWTYMMRLLKAPGAPMASRHAEDLVFYATLGIIIGGRLGYVLFYGPVQFWHHPFDIFKLWDGGMSFHGGVIGTTIGIILFARRHKLDWLRIHDYVACCAPMGLFLGRLANFVNGELWGKPTGTSWGIIFHGSAGEMARHPSQLYEAGLEGVLLFAVLWFAFWRTKARYDPGKLVGLFVFGYGVARFAVEFFREPDQQFVGTIFDNGYLHMGQWLCVPMILGGLYLIGTAKNRRQRVTPIAGDESVA